MKSKRAREATEADDKPAAGPVDVVGAPQKKRKRSSEDDTAADLKKAKKDKKDKKHKKESRKERKEKRKNLQDLPDQDDNDDDEDQPTSKQDAEEDSPMVDVDSKPASATADAAGSDKPSKKDKNKKKRDKRDKEAEPRQQQGAQDGTSADAETTEEPKDKKKSKKDKKNKTKPSDGSATPKDAPDGTDADTADPDADAKADRHIVFVGNLPFTATAASIEAHFASLNPVSVRCMSDPKDSKPCRGFAFVEFAKVWHMRTCLDKFHHSMFEDGVSPARRINVELTAGGGGKTKQRQEKIKEKNRKLDENRAKRIAREKTTKEEARANGTSGQQQQHLGDGIHPSRRARVPGNSW
ncbi:hypothetical protein ACJ41O_010015 [Fusarium nematophilum]